MTIQEALNLYKIPYTVTSTTTAGGFASYQLSPAGSTATPERLKSKLNALIVATGQADLSIIQDGSNLYLRHKSGSPYFDYFDYNGYIDFNNPDIPFIVGMNQDGLIFDSIAAARHLLVAGTTGSGKSVFLHTLIYTMLCNPQDYVYLVDCKKVEFDIYRNNARVCDEVFGNESCAVYVNTLVDTMESRYARMQAAGVNDFSDFIKIYPDEKRYILVIDELNDLIMSKEAKKAIIPQLLRIAQKGRAAGCHLILSTQRPDATVINGTLKGNIPTRLSFKTRSNIDSRIILDVSGAERLTGNGDGLYLRNAAFIPERIQAPYITLEQIRDRERQTA